MLKYALIGCAGFALAAGAQTWRLDRVKADLVEARIEIAALTEFKALAITDATDQAAQCAARVADARASARRIETIIERPVPNDANGCPARPLLSGDELRQTLQPGTNPAEPLR
jgi:inactivated superfamily I helicase